MQIILLGFVSLVVVSSYEYILIAYSHFTKMSEEKITWKYLSEAEERKMVEKE